MTNLDFSNVLNAVNQSAAANTAKSQAFAREQMQFNAQQAALNRSWQENMSSTAHQREVKDLLAAGLNPILSSGGTGASTPTGSAASGASGKVDESYSTALSNYLMSLISSATAINTAGISAGAILGSAQTSAKAAVSSALGSAALNLVSNITGHKISANASRYGSDKSFKAALGSSGISAAGNILSSLVSAKARKPANITNIW